MFEWILAKLMFVWLEEGGGRMMQPSLQQTIDQNRSFIIGLW
jgi:hypothetical protein